MASKISYVITLTEEEHNLFDFFRGQDEIPDFLKRCAVNAILDLTLPSDADDESVKWASSAPVVLNKDDRERLLAMLDLLSNRK